MPLTVSELCKLTEPQMIPRAGVKGRKNRVKWLVSTEHLEPREWLRGGEFLVMCGWNLRPSRSMLHRYIDHLHTSNLSGLGFGVGFKFEKIPDQLLERADTLGFPVCEVPFELAFAQISRRATDVIYQEQHGGSSLSSHLQNATLNDAIDGRFMLEDIAVHISHTLLCNTFFVCQRRGTIAHAMRNRSEKLQEINPECRTSRQCLSLVRLELHRDESTLSKSEKIFLDEMVLAAKIVLSKDQAVAIERERLTVDLIDEIADKDLLPGFVVQRLTAFGLDTTANYSTIVIKSFDRKHVPELQRARNFISAWSEIVLSANREDNVEGIWVPKSQSQVEHVFDEACSKYPNLSIGLSEIVPAVELKKSIQQARSIAGHTRRGIYGQSEASIEELLAVTNSVTAMEFVSKVLPKDVSTSELHEIEVLLDQGFNINEAAVRLGIHRHTLRSKIERFLDVTGLNIRNPEIRQNAWLAIKLERIHRQRN